MNMTAIEHQADIDRHDKRTRDAEAWIEGYLAWLIKRLHAFDEALQLASPPLRDDITNLLWQIAADANRPPEERRQDYLYRNLQHKLWEVLYMDAERAMRNEDGSH